MTGLFVLTVLAVHRLTQMLTQDLIAKPFRDLIERAVTDARTQVIAVVAVGAINAVTCGALFAFGAPGPLIIYISLVSLSVALWLLFAGFFLPMLECAACASVWMSALVVGGVSVASTIGSYPAELGLVEGLLWWLAASSLTIMLNTILGRIEYQ